MYFQRIFRNNSYYDNHKSLPYIKDLAYIAKTFIFSDRANEGNWRMNPGEHGVKLYDFMSIELKFIEASASEFGDNTIEEWLAEMRQIRESSDIFSTDIVRYADDAHYPSLIDYVYISHISWETALDLLWAAYIYADVCLRLSGKEKWEIAKNNLYPLMQKNFGGGSMNYFNELSIIKNTEEAIEMMISRVSKIDSGSTEVPAANDSEQEASLSKVEQNKSKSQNKSKKKPSTPLKGETTESALDEDKSKLIATIEEQEKTIKDQTKTIKELTPKFENLKQKFNDLTGSFQEKQKQLEELTVKFKDITIKYQQKEKELEELRSQQALQADETSLDEIAIYLLAPLFAEQDMKTAGAFYHELSGKDDIGVADVIVKYKKDFSHRMRNVDLWRILHIFGKYTSTDRNFDTALRKLKFRDN